MFILEDDDYWSFHFKGHKYSEVTPSFSFVRDEDESIIDISLLESLPSVNEALYLDNSWHPGAHPDEIILDIQGLPEWEQKSLVAAAGHIFPIFDHRTSELPEAKARKAPKRNVNAVRREANA